MNAFVVELENKPGELARVTEAIASKHINITSFTGGTCGDKGTISLLTNDEAGTRSALSAAGCTFKESEVVPASLADEPGSLAKAARRLADAGVNIEAVMPTGMSGNKVTVAFVTSNPTRARQALAAMEAATV